MQDMENMARQCPDPDNPVVEEYTYWFLHNATRFYAYDPLCSPPTLASLLSGLVLLLDGCLHSWCCLVYILDTLTCIQILHINTVNESRTEYIMDTRQSTYTNES